LATESKHRKSDFNHWDSHQFQSAWFTKQGINGGGGTSHTAISINPHNLQTSLGVLANETMGVNQKSGLLSRLLEAS
jgi:hypothetical protein